METETKIAEKQKMITMQVSEKILMYPSDQAILCPQCRKEDLKRDWTNSVYTCPHCQTEYEAEHTRCSDLPVLSPYVLLRKRY